MKSWQQELNKKITDRNAKKNCALLEFFFSANKKLFLLKGVDVFSFLLKITITGKKLQLINLYFYL